MGRSNGVVGRPVALQERWNRGDLETLGYGVGPDSELGGSNSRPPEISVTTSATPHAKGAWVEVVASTSKRHDGIVIVPEANNASATDTSRLLDIGIGAASSEVVIVENIDCGYTNNGGTDPAMVAKLPVNIPAGSRIAFRVQGVQTSDADDIYFRGYLESQSRRASPASLVTMGASTGTSAGTTLTAPGVADTKSAWTQITASTAQPFRGIVCCLGIPAGTTVSNSGYILADFAIGASGSEQVFAANIPVYHGFGETLDGERYRTVAVHVPAGSRIAARYQASQASSQLAASVIGVPY